MNYEKRIESMYEKVFFRQNRIYSSGYILIVGAIITLCGIIFNHMREKRLIKKLKRLIKKLMEN